VILQVVSGNKKHTVKVRDKTVDLKKTKNFYGRLIVLARSNRDNDRYLRVHTDAPIIICSRWLSAAMQWQVQIYPRTREDGHHWHRPCTSATVRRKHTFHDVRCRSLPIDCWSYQRKRQLWW